MRWVYDDGPDECRDCNGSGTVWIRPKGHCFEYPGGKALGMWSKERYDKGTPEMPWNLHTWDHTDKEIDTWPLNYYGSFLDEQFIRCTCGVEGTLKDNEVHVKEMKQKWIEEHND
jgi:hypothetical protein